MSDLLVTLDEMQPEDLPFVMSSWLRSYDPKGHPSSVEAARYYRDQHALAKRCIDQGHVLLAVYALPAVGFARQLAGWVCGNQAQLHYVYVKNILRSQGIGTRLVEHMLGGNTKPEYTHDTPSWRGLMRDLQRRQARNWTNASDRTRVSRLVADGKPGLDVAGHPAGGVLGVPKYVGEGD